MTQFARTVGGAMRYLIVAIASLGIILLPCLAAMGTLGEMDELEMEEDVSEAQSPIEPTPVLSGLR